MRYPLTPHPHTPHVPPTPLTRTSRVLARGKLGVVAYIGPSDLGDGTYIGVDLGSSGGGEHNGTVNGRKYFTCKPGQGLLLPAKEVGWVREGGCLCGLGGCFRSSMPGTDAQVLWHGHTAAAVLAKMEFNLADGLRRR